MRRFVPPRRTNLGQPWYKCFMDGRLWPLSHIVEYEGHYYCKEHYAAKFNKKLLADAPIDFIGKDDEYHGT